jgi:hypothetical protein
MATVQLWSVRHSFESNWTDCLKRLADLGVKQIETYGTETHGPARLKKLFDAVNLTVYAMHVPPPPAMRLYPSDSNEYVKDLESYVDHMTTDAKTLETPRLVIMRDAENPFEMSDGDFCKSIKTASAKLKKSNLSLMFHPYHTDLLQHRLSDEPQQCSFTTRLANMCTDLDFEIDIFFIVLAAFEELKNDSKRTLDFSSRLLTRAIEIAIRLADTLKARIKALHVNGWRLLTKTPLGGPTHLTEHKLAQHWITDETRISIQRLLEPFAIISPQPHLILEHDITVNGPDAPHSRAEQCFYSLEKSLRSSRKLHEPQFALLTSAYTKTSS